MSQVPIYVVWHPLTTLRSDATRDPDETESIFQTSPSRRIYMTAHRPNLLRKKQGRPGEPKSVLLNE